MAEERSFAHPVQTILAAAAALAAECALVQAFLRPHAWRPGLGALHLGITGALILWYRFSPGVRTDVRIPLFLIATTGALGPVGPAAALTVMALSSWFMRSATPFEEWHRNLFPEMADDAVGEMVRRAALAEVDNPASLAPFSDVLAFGSLHQKQALIALLNRSFRPAFGPILKRALTDESNAVRVQAATAINHLENTLHARTLELSRQAREQPDNPAALLALARHYDEYLYSRILDPRREKETQKRAIEAYTRYLAMQPGDPEARSGAGRLFLRCGHYTEAAESLKTVIEGGAAGPHTKLWYLESLYRLGRYAELRAGARLLNEDPAAGTLPFAARDTLQLWATQEAVPQ